MEELKPEELEQLVQELEGESDEEEALSPEVEKLLRGLGRWSPEQTQRDAAAQLGKMRKSNPQIVQALIAACQSPSGQVRAAAAKSLRAPAHQECLQQRPELAAAAESALQQAPDTDWLKGTLSGQGKGASVQRRIYPGFRIQARTLLMRIMGVPFVLFGLGALLGAAIFVTQGIDLAVLMLGVFGLVFTYVGLYAAGLDLKEFLLALLHRRAWQGPQATADGRITDRDIEEHKHKDDYGRVSYTYTYWVTFDFSTTEGPVRLKTPVVEKWRYDQLKRGQPVKVRYAQEDPRLALLEWELDW
jgi:hypothetical protein